MKNLYFRLKGCSLGRYKDERNAENLNIVIARQI